MSGLSHFVRPLPGFPAKAIFKELAVFFLFSFLAFVSLALLLASWFKPGLCPLKNASRTKAAIFYLVLALVFLLLAQGGTSRRTQSGQSSGAAKTAVGAPPVGGVLAWREVLREEVPVPANGRTRLLLTIVPDEDQSGALQQDLLSTARGAAIKYQKEKGVPVVAVRLIAGQADSALAEPLLAHVVYIPDGKGFDGDRQGMSEWETLLAAKRGFTGQELEYIGLWAALYKDFQGRSGLREAELDAAVSEKLGIAPGSLKPFDNRLEAADARETDTQ